MELSEIIFFEPGCALEATGPDARSFLQGQFSNDLSKMGPGELVRGLWLNRKGRILAESSVLAKGEDCFWVVSSFSSYERVEKRLSDYLIMDEVSLSRVAVGWTAACVRGPERAWALEFVGCPDLGMGGFFFGNGALAFAGRRGELDTIELLLDEKRALELRAEAARLESMGRIRVGGIDRFRNWAVESMAPRIGIDVGESDLPQEVGLVDGWVSFSKGCYLGQEVMARLRSMGRTRKRLARVRIEYAEGKVALPAELLDEHGKRRGELRVVAEREGGWQGLAIVSLDAPGPLLLAVAGQDVAVEIDPAAEGGAT